MTYSCWNLINYESRDPYKSFPREKIEFGPKGTRAKTQKFRSTEFPTSRVSYLMKFSRKLIDGSKTVGWSSLEVVANFWQITFILPPTPMIMPKVRTPCSSVKWFLDRKVTDLQLRDT